MGVFFCLFELQFLVLDHTPLALVAAILLLLLLFPFLTLLPLLLLLVLLLEKVVKLTFLPADPEVVNQQPEQDHNEDAKHDVGAE